MNARRDADGRLLHRDGRRMSTVSREALARDLAAIARAILGEPVHPKEPGAHRAPERRQ